VITPFAAKRPDAENAAPNQELRPEVPLASKAPQPFVTGTVTQRLAAVLLAMLVLFALTGLLVWPAHAVQDLSRFLDAPSLAEPLGRDHLGRSVVARLAHATRLSLLMAVLCVATALLVGTFAGIAAAWRGGWIDAVLHGLSEAFIALPALLVVLIFSAIANGDLWTLYVGLAPRAVGGVLPHGPLPQRPGARRAGRRGRRDAQAGPRPHRAPSPLARIASATDHDGHLRHRILHPCPVDLGIRGGRDPSPTPELGLMINRGVPLLSRGTVDVPRPRPHSHHHPDRAAEPAKQGNPPMSMRLNHLVVSHTRTTLVEVSGLDFEPGRPVTIVGESGSGKSLLAHAIMGTLPANLTARGSLSMDGQSYDLADRANRRRLWGRVMSLLPQESGLALDPTMRTREQVAEGARSFTTDRRTARRSAGTLLAALGLGQASAAFPHTISGGMAQRVAFAAATIGDAPVLIADEPSKGLDKQARAELAGAH
jgi:ABC-type dipeptide/oligopeptide/nickel transport system ATPase subunit